jgi:UDP-galactopyranose mutase
MEKESILIVGSGLSGATLADHSARDGYNVVVIEKRDHIGGNVYDEIDQQTGIRISKYGAHLFHTNDQEVWDYVNKFGKWVRWDHRVIADCSGQYIPLPVCIETVNTLFGESIQSEEDMKEWLEKEIEHIEGPVINSEQSAITRVGRRLYDILFKEYTRKQWAKGAEELEASVLERIPIRVNHDTRYFSDKFQALPLDGYTSIVQSMLSHPNITVKLNTAWEDVNKEEWKVVFFTGPIDVYFKSSGLPPLEYRSIDFHWERIPERGYAQPNSVVNYPSAAIPFTRSVEYKYFLHQKSDWTILSRETTSDNGEPYYPVPTQRNRDLYKEYLKLAEAAPKNVHFVGRLASYKYLNMDQAIRNAIDYYRCGIWRDK